MVGYVVKPKVTAPVSSYAQNQWMGYPCTFANGRFSSKAELEDFMERQANYLRCPSAFWNRPDGDFLSDEPYVPRYFYYDVVTDMMVETREPAP